jgi:predicted nuclease with TOPRIM domain
MEIFKNIATVVGCISACLALLVAIIKPLRQLVIDSFVRKSQYTQLFDKVNEINEKMDKSIKQNDQLEKRLTRVEENVLDNEADRIRAELFDCGNRCRRGIRLHPEEMEHIRAIYHKYKDVLHQNHEGDAEFLFITNYYNQQSFPPYHTQQND